MILPTTWYSYIVIEGLNHAEHSWIVLEYI